MGWGNGARCNECNTWNYDGDYILINDNAYCYPCRGKVTTEIELTLNHLLEAISEVEYDCLCQDGLAEALIHRHSPSCRIRTNVLELERNLIDTTLIGERTFGVDFE